MKKYLQEGIVESSFEIRIGDKESKEMSAVIKKSVLDTFPEKAVNNLLVKKFMQSLLCSHCNLTLCHLGYRAEKKTWGCPWFPLSIVNSQKS